MGLFDSFVVVLQSLVLHKPLLLVESDGALVHDMNMQVDPLYLLILLLFLLPLVLPFPFLLLFTLAFLFIFTLSQTPLHLQDHITPYLQLSVLLQYNKGEDVGHILLFKRLCPHSVCPNDNVVVIDELGVLVVLGYYLVIEPSRVLDGETAVIEQGELVDVPNVDIPIGYFERGSWNWAGVGLGGELGRWLCLLLFCHRIL